MIDCRLIIFLVSFSFFVFRPFAYFVFVLNFVRIIEVRVKHWTTVDSWRHPFIHSWRHPFSSFLALSLLLAARMSDFHGRWDVRLPRRDVCPTYVLAYNKGRQELAVNKS